MFSTDLIWISAQSDVVLTTEKELNPSLTYHTTPYHQEQAAKPTIAEAAVQLHVYIEMFLRS